MPKCFKFDNQNLMLEVVEKWHCPKNLLLQYLPFPKCRKIEKKRKVRGFFLSRRNRIFARDKVQWPYFRRVFLSIC